MFNRMYKTGYNWCLKYGKGAILVIFVYLFLEISKQLINKYFGINIDEIFLMEHFSVYGSIISCFVLFIETWVGLEFLNYIYKGETEEKYDFALFDKVKLYIMPAFVCAFILNASFTLLTSLISITSKMFTLAEGPGLGKALWMILMLVFILFGLPLLCYLYLRFSLYIEAVIVNSIKDPILALKESFKITRGRVWDIVRVLILPIMLLMFIVIGVVVIFGGEKDLSSNILGYAVSFIHPLLAAVSLALYLEFRKDSIEESAVEEQIEK